MHTKNQVLKIVDSYKDAFIKYLKLSHLSIKWEILHSSDKQSLVKHGITRGFAMAQTTWNSLQPRTKTYHIIMYYDLQGSKKDIVGTMFHELLHVRLRQWDSIIKKKFSSKHCKLEENLILDIEKLLVDLF